MSTLPQSPTRDERPGGAPGPMDRPTNVLIVGVGGQGVLMISKVLAQVSAGRGLEVKQSEVHGMAKRGGVVFSHVRFGNRVWSPTIPKGEADVVVALEWAEGLRWLPYLDPDRGTFLADTRRIVPPFACRDRRPGGRSSYPTRGEDAVRGKAAQSIALDALGVAEELGEPRAANTVLLGALSTVLDFSAPEWHAAIEASVPPRSLEVNRAAFDRGRDWTRSPDEADGVAPVSREGEAEWAPEAVEVPAAGSSVSFEIDAVWCKGCEICVKLCPERSLELDERQVARLTDPRACTGCRICEWLCPDFAIRVRMGPLEEEGGS